MDSYLLIIFLVVFSLFVTFLYLYLRNLKEAQSDKKLRNDFTAMVIHELRSPLSIIKSSADLLQKQDARLASEQKKNLLSQIENSANDLLSIVNDLLNVAKVEAGKIELFKHQFQITEILEEEIKNFRPLAEEKGIEIKLYIDSDVDGVNCDKDKIKQVMNNLLSNAIKYSTEGTIAVKLQSFHGYVQISVEDQGIGISDSLKKKLFSKFVQARELPVSREGGTGLGLVISKGIIEAHGGKIWIQDNQPKGSIFIFTLPVD